MLITTLVAPPINGTPVVVENRQRSTTVPGTWTSSNLNSAFVKVMEQTPVTGLPVVVRGYIIDGNFYDPAAALLVLAGQGLAPGINQAVLNEAPECASLIPPVVP